MNENENEREKGQGDQARMNVVLHWCTVDEILEALDESSHLKAARLAELLNERSKKTPIDIASQELSREGLDENDYDFDDSPAVSPCDRSIGGSGGAYVQIWRWISRKDAIEKILEDNPNLSVTQCASCGKSVKLIPGTEWTVHVDDKGEFLDFGCGSLPATK